MKSENWSDYYHRLSLIFNSLIAISIVPFGLILLKLETSKENFESQVPALLSSVLVWIILPMAILASWYVLKTANKQYKLAEKRTLSEKLALYKKVEVRKYLILSGVAILSLLGLWLTNSYWFVIIYFVMLALYSIINPSEKRIKKKLVISDEAFQEFKT